MLSLHCKYKINNKHLITQILPKIINKMFILGVELQLSHVSHSSIKLTIIMPPNDIGNPKKYNDMAVTYKK